MSCDCLNCRGVGPDPGPEFSKDDEIDARVDAAMQALDELVFAAQKGERFSHLESALRWEIEKLGQVAKEAKD